MARKRKPTVVGIDPGYAKAAVCVGTCAADCDPVLYETKPRDNSVTSRIHRYYEMVSKIMTAVDYARPDWILIEYYSHKSEGSAANRLWEFGGVLRSELLETRANIVEVPPINLKQFCRWKGSGTKVQMVATMTKRWGVLFDTEDQYDAYGLARMGLVIAKIEPSEHEAQDKAIYSVLNGALADDRFRTGD